ncbi:adenylyltransferase/cytidyltransferase family protein [Pseudomonas gingeri]|uniref:nicotinate-nucleotide adenylyltransferase n=1 Tax=Pseudomonas gingeri TaxID=117681 RepID=A0A7Y7YBB9_9PSED|nr:adenylyltransferase/cytidyltransferase family protein [Pseudomonas gingeri]NVZ99507.1 adenylyltransferase/cytidyltransferase family protein [Pseudomonas gingeri]NWA15471.1 adenylyltransferase/cytidyltransferase family protein [Pseudomonas gingeri]NWA56698.1 adenylyltransferase/cytidyltransferase family protein [Pseudomonas gingeri]NWA95192.1 adenylyltransferase/cytidyltransferase family protein [Pseudomonas gingeri]NWB05274.1 adenylyltransferase/cytidyltransferase family protein [Pseudomona
MYELAVYGGAFNPPHAGHAQVMIEASRHARSVWVVPSFRHPHGKRMADYERRLGWLQGIVEQVRPDCSSAISVCRIEQRLAQGETVPTQWMAPGMDPVDYGLYAAHRT